MAFMPYIIPLTTLMVIGVFFWEWNVSGNHFGISDPPLNDNIRHSGYQAVIALVVSVCVVLMRPPTKLMIAFLYVVVLSAIFGVTFWMGGRGGWVAAVVTILVLMLLMFLYKCLNKLSLLLVLLGLILGVVVSELFAVAPWNGFGSNMLRFIAPITQENIIQGNIGLATLDQVSTNRLAIWHSVLESLETEYLFGLGALGYYFMDSYIPGAGYHPHNMLLQFYADWGVIGASLFLALLGIAFWRGFKLHVLQAKALNLVSISAGAIICVLTVHGLFDGTYFHPQPLYYLILAYAIWVTDRGAA